jgi:hypothetical protein
MSKSQSYGKWLFLIIIIIIIGLIVLYLINPVSFFNPPPVPDSDFYDTSVNVEISYIYNLGHVFLAMKGL